MQTTVTAELNDEQIAVLNSVADYLGEQPEDFVRAAIAQRIDSMREMLEDLHFERCWR